MPYINDTGLPSVTDVLNPYIDTRFFTQEDCDRGDAVHASMAAHCLGVWSPPLPIEWQPYFDSGRRWVDECVDRVVLAEERLVNRVKTFCGKPDLVAVIKGNDLPTLIDWKTSQTYYEWWRLQNASYRYLLEDSKQIKTMAGMCVRLKKNGSGILLGKGHYPGEYLSDFAIFHGGLNMYRFFNRKAA